MAAPDEVLDWIDEGRRRDGDTRDGDPASPWRRYNIAPSQRVIVVGRDAGGENVVRGAVWGFRPRWLTADRRAPINARAETVGTTPMFRSAFSRGRCVVPADGWYEWQDQAHGPKRPYFFRRPDDDLFYFAGIAATDADGRRTMAIVTGEANSIAKPIHKRMPIVLPSEAATDAWLAADSAASTLDDLLAPPPVDLVEAYPVGRAVNKPQNDGPHLIEGAPE